MFSFQRDSVSTNPGSSANRASFTRKRNGSSPIAPSPMCSCRSTRHPSGFFESFRWNARTCASPTTASSSAIVRS